MYCFSIDYLQIFAQTSLDLTQIREFTPLDADYTYGRFTKAAFFKQGIEILDDEELVATLYYEPTSPKVSPNSVAVRWDNHVFYTDKLVHRILSIFKALFLYHVSITRCDFALDFDELDGHDGAALAQLLINEDIIKRGSRQMSVVYKRRHHVAPTGAVTQRQGAGIESVTIGKMSSACQFCLYNKTAEIKHSGKKYIEEYQAMNGLDTGKDIWRLELRLRAAGLMLQTPNGGERRLRIEDIVQTSLFVNILNIVFDKWAALYYTDGNSTPHEISRLRRLVIPTIKPTTRLSRPIRRTLLPHSNYLKGVVNTIRKAHTLIDIDGLDVNDAIWAIEYASHLSLKEIKEQARLRSDLGRLADIYLDNVITNQLH